MYARIAYAGAAGRQPEARLTTGNVDIVGLEKELREGIRENEQVLK